MLKQTACNFGNRTSVKLPITRITISYYKREKGWRIKDPKKVITGWGNLTKSANEILSIGGCGFVQRNGVMVPWWDWRARGHFNFRCSRGSDATDGMVVQVIVDPSELRDSRLSELDPILIIESR